MLTYRTFTDEAGAIDLAHWLNAHHIPAEADGAAPMPNPYIPDSILTRAYVVRIPSTQFEAADTALRAYFKTQFNRLPADYYLYSFTDEELLAILKTPDEWGDLDFALAQELLVQHGIPVSVATLESYKEARLAQLDRPVSSGRPYIFWGYVFAFIIPVVAIPIGYQLSRATQTLPSGALIYVYPERTQQHGRNIMWLGIVLTLSGVVTVLTNSLMHYL